MAAILLALLAAAPSPAQSNIDPAMKYCWNENVGFINFHDAGPDGAHGVVIRSTRLSGWAWAENAGWINLGDDQPPVPPHYQNASSNDFGVNIATDASLFGFAWSENLGWVNFDTRLALRPFNQHARIDRPARRLRGFAWAENAGWINLDHAPIHVRFRSLCPADFNADNSVQIADLFAFLSRFFSEFPSCADDRLADFNADGCVEIADLFAFLSAWFSAFPNPCP